jgi:hypothetical protein
MCGGIIGDVVNKVTGGGGSGGQAPVVGQPETAKTQIGDTGAPVAVGKRKPRSLLSGTALGDTSTAQVAPVTAKPTLGG